MRSRLALLLFGLGLVLASAAPALAQPDPPTYSAVTLDAVLDGARADLTLIIMVHDGLDPVVAGFQIYRSVLGVCGPETLLTLTPFPREGVGLHYYHLTDDAMAENVVYRYRAVAVSEEGYDVGRDPFLMYVGIDYAGWGDDTVCGRGTLVDWGAYTPMLEPCADSCFVPMFVDSGDPGFDPWDHVDGTVLEFVGFISCGGPEGCILTATAVRESECVSVPARDFSWGAWKAGY